MAALDIIQADFNNPKLIELLKLHLQDMYATSPKESVHALAIEELQAEHISFWTLTDGNDILGCVALKELAADHGELKSLKTHPQFLKRGVAKRLVEFAIQKAQERHYQRISLETGTEPYFIPAQHLYKKLGFIETLPFGSYQEDPNSCFMQKDL
ncbi:GNAT family N-acetyltransferase [Listeria grayi]|uniref:GNAT family N-acetyltransferase n=1 Tax=Listeria grayi TaxID=1641 RepID=UPI0016292392|nr:GNAT family N-acetyltransferase [Listeria grayi]